MVLENIPEFFKNKFSTSSPNTEDENSEDDTTNSTNTNSEEESAINRPPGWDAIYGTYEKPVFPKEKEVVEILESLNKASDIVDFNTYLPPLGTNKEHIQLELYTVDGKSDSRTLVVDAHITDFSEWLPEESENWKYPEECLGNNGPYYLHLSDDFQDILNVPPFGFTLVEYNSDEDYAIYSYERPLYPKRDERE